MEIILKKADGDIILSESRIRADLLNLVDYSSTEEKPLLSEFMDKFTKVSYSMPYNTFLNNAKNNLYNKVKYGSLTLDNVTKILALNKKYLLYIFYLILCHNLTDSDLINFLSLSSNISRNSFILSYLNPIKLKLSDDDLSDLDALNQNSVRLLDNIFYYFDMHNSNDPNNYSGRVAKLPKDSDIEKALFCEVKHDTLVNGLYKTRMYSDLKSDLHFNSDAFSKFFKVSYRPKLSNSFYQNYCISALNKTKNFTTLNIAFQKASFFNKHLLYSALTKFNLIDLEKSPDFECLSHVDDEIFNSSIIDSVNIKISTDSNNTKHKSYYNFGEIKDYKYFLNQTTSPEMSDFYTTNEDKTVVYLKAMISDNDGNILKVVHINYDTEDNKPRYFYDFIDYFEKPFTIDDSLTDVLSISATVKVQNDADKENSEWKLGGKTMTLGDIFDRVLDDRMILYEEKAKSDFISQFYNDAYIVTRKYFPYDAGSFLGTFLLSLNLKENWIKDSSENIIYNINDQEYKNTKLKNAVNALNSLSDSDMGTNALNTKKMLENFHNCVFLNEFKKNNSISYNYFFQLHDSIIEGTGDDTKVIGRLHDIFGIFALPGYQLSPTILPTDRTEADHIFEKNPGYLTQRLYTKYYDDELKDPNFSEKTYPTDNDKKYSLDYYDYFISYDLRDFTDNKTIYQKYYSAISTELQELDNLLQSISKEDYQTYLNKFLNKKYPIFYKDNIIHVLGSKFIDSCICKKYLPALVRYQQAINLNNEKIEDNQSNHIKANYLNYLMPAKENEADYEHRKTLLNFLKLWQSMDLIMTTEIKESDKIVRVDSLLGETLENAEALQADYKTLLQSIYSYKDTTDEINPEKIVFSIKSLGTYQNNFNQLLKDLDINENLNEYTENDIKEKLEHILKSKYDSDSELYSELINLYEQQKSDMDKFYFIIYLDLFFNYIEYLFDDNFKEFKNEVSIYSFLLFRMMFLLKESFYDLYYFLSEINRRCNYTYHKDLPSNFATYSTKQKLDYDSATYNPCSLGRIIGNLNNTLKVKK